jgi:hypothetical protein
MINVTTIRIKKLAGTFAENKDIASTIREERIFPALKKGHALILDFAGVETATQSFVHVLISQPIRDYGIDVLDRMTFKDCNSIVQNIVEIVVDYMQRES